MSRLDIKTPSKAQMVVEHLYRSMEHRIEASPPGLCPIDMALNFLNLCVPGAVLRPDVREMRALPGGPGAAVGPAPRGSGREAVFGHPPTD